LVILNAYYHYFDFIQIAIAIAIKIEIKIKILIYNNKKKVIYTIHFLIFTFILKQSVYVKKKKKLSLLIL